jgi:ketosteroid isomerase-like protein
MKMRLRSLLFLLAGLAPAAMVVHAQEAATEPAKAPTQIQVMQKLEDSWSDALAKRDQYGLELVLSPQFVDISETGEVRSRNQQIAYILNRFPDLISLEQTVVSVRTLGDVALVNGTYILRRRSNGKPVEERGVFSHVFQRSRNTWQCINAQRTTVLEQAVNGKPAAGTQKKSNAELPFHVPFLHKGDDSASQGATSTPQKTPQ